ncbi:TPA: hypothetical protein QDB21_005621 [Burkholderia vietnamiensis]|nr:hypothetical protein [Burkholderia vietnamiensis]
MGDIAHFYGARFEIISTELHEPHEHDELPVMVAIGKWIDGAAVRGYFGPDKDWNFQGNKRARVAIEPRA